MIAKTTYFLVKAYYSVQAIHQPCLQVYLMNCCPWLLDHLFDKVLSHIIDISLYFVHFIYFAYSIYLIYLGREPFTKDQNAMVLCHEPLLLWPKTVHIAKCCFLDKSISEIYIVIADLVFLLLKAVLTLILILICLYSWTSVFHNIAPTSDSEIV